MRYFVLNVLVFLGLLFPSTVKAQLFLEEGKVVLTVEAGERVNKFITVSNTSAEEVHFKVYWEDFEYQTPYDGLKKFSPAGVAAFSASKWFNFSPQEVTLPGFGKQKIEYSVAVPSNIDRGYYGVLFFERSGLSMDGATGLNLVTRVGCLFFIEPKEASRTASIEDIKVEEGKIKGDFLNTSNVTSIPRMLYYFMDEGGLVKDRGELKKMYIPAGATGGWELAVPNSFSSGRYTVVMNVDLGEENNTSKEITILKDASGLVSLESVRD